MLLRRQVLSFPFPTHLAPSHEVLFAHLLLTDAPLLTEKKIQFNLQSRTKECNLIFFSGLVLFHFSELCTPVVVRGVSGQVSKSLTGSVHIWEIRGDSRCIPCFHVWVLAASWHCLTLSVLFSSLPFLTIGSLDGAVFVSCSTHHLGQLLWRTNVKTPVRMARGLSDKLIYISELPLENCLNLTLSSGALAVYERLGILVGIN